MILCKPWRLILAAALLIPFVFVGRSAAASQAGTILFDEGHGQRFVIGQDGELQLSGLAQVMREAGAVVESTGEKLTPQLLDGKKALVISGPFVDYSRAEIDAIVSFLLQGGRCAILLHIPNPVGLLLQRLDIVVSKGIVHERENTIDGKDIDFYITSLVPHPVTKGLKRFAVYGCWALLGNGPNVSVVGATSAKAWIDVDHNNTFGAGDLVHSLSIMMAGKLGKGEYLVSGDDAIFQNRFLVGDNRRLAENFAAWLLR